MKKYDLELSILSCLLQKPELMESVKLKDEHFQKYKKIWVFMKAVYKKFGDFDLTIMTSVSKNKYHIIEYIQMIIDVEPAPSKFETYQKQLIEEYSKDKNEEYIKNRIYELATDLYVGNIKLENFNTNLKMIYRSAELLKESEK